MSMKITVVQNDTKYDLNFTLQDNAGAAMNLTGATLLFKAQHQDGDALAFNGSMNIVNAASGQCKYTVQNGDFDQSGEYYAEIEITYPSQQVVTYSDIIITVTPELPR